MQLIDYKSNNSTFLYFDCLSSMANVQVNDKNMTKWSDTTKDRRNESWYGVKTIEELRTIVERTGWDKGVKQGLDAIGQLTAPKLPSFRRKRCYGSYGHSVDVSRLISGNYNQAWSTSKKEVTRKKMNRRGLVNIIVDHGANCGTGSDSFFWRGAVGVILANAIQTSGRKVRLLSGFSIDGFTYDNGKGSKNLTCLLEVKKFDQPLEYNSMFAVTALAGFFRYYGFKAILSVPFEVAGGMGHASSLDVERADYILDDNPCIVVENIWNADAAKKKANQLVEELEQ